MNRILAGAVAGAAVCAAIFGAGTAYAKPDTDAYKGNTYEQVVGAVGKGNVSIVSRVGEYLPTEKCVVSGSRNGNFADASGNPTGASVLVDLNCNDPNTAGHPGYSAATPTGKKAQQLRQSVTFINQDFAKAAETGNPSWCADNASTCAAICQKDGAACSDEVLSFLGL